MDDRDCLRLTVSKELALAAQDLCLRRGVPLNVTQAVNALLKQSINSGIAAEPAGVDNNGPTRT